MPANENEFGASCPCGSVNLVVQDRLIAQVYCHCDDCQHAHGAPLVPRAIVARDDVSVGSGEIRKWLHNVRSMVICTNCGTHLYSERDGSAYRGVNAALFPPGKFQPHAHIHCKYAVAPVVDGLTHFSDLPAEFGGSGQLVDW